jgi:casein kinase I family protein HRR25
MTGTNLTNGESVAIKLESTRARHPQLEYEARVYKALAGGGKLFRHPKH